MGHEGRVKQVRGEPSVGCMNEVLPFRTTTWCLCYSAWYWLFISPPQQYEYQDSARDAVLLAPTLWVASIIYTSIFSV